MFNRTVDVVKIVVQIHLVLVQLQGGISTIQFVIVAINNETKVYHAHYVDELTGISRTYQWFNVKSVKNLSIKSVMKPMLIWCHTCVQTVGCFSSMR